MLPVLSAVVYERVTHVMFTADILNVTGAAIPPAAQVLNGETLPPTLAYVRFAERLGGGGRVAAEEANVATVLVNAAA